jgi:hypothetical protein
VPAFLLDRYDVFIIRGGLGYATAADVNSPGDGTVNLFSVSGTHCGSVEFPRGMQLWFGRDGTVIGFGATDRCMVTWWPSLFR